MLLYLKEVISWSYLLIDAIFLQKYFLIIDYVDITMKNIANLNCFHIQYHFIIVLKYDKLSQV